MKYYIYISDTKVDMLYAQIPQSIKSKIASELKIDLKLISATFKDRDKQLEETRYSKLQLVVDYIDNHLDVGTTDYPGAYFKDTLPMRWGPYSNRGKPTDIVYFGGYTDQTILGLGGSLKHVIGSNGESGNNWFASHGPFLLQALSEDDSSNTTLQSEDVYVVDIATNRMQGPVFQVEFLAKRIIYGPIASEQPNITQAVLGSPIYVALAE